MNFKNIWVYLRTNSGQFGTEMGKAGAHVRAFSKIAEDMGKKGQNAGKSWMTVGNMVRVGLLAGAVALGAFVAKAAAFETQMRNVNSISYMSERALARLGEEVLSLSNELPQSAETAAAGLYQIASSGFAGAEGIDVLKASMQAASAGLSTTATAANAIAAALNAYGLEATDAGHVSDVLFQTVNLGVITFEELAQQLGDVVGIGAAAGVRFEEIGAAIATITRAGIPAAEATTSLNRLIQSLLDPSEALAATAERLGINLGSALQDPAIGLHGIMQKLGEVAGDNVNIWLQWLPEIRAARGAFALTAADGKIATEVWAGFTDEAKLSGTTVKALNEQSKALSFQMGILRNNITNAAISIGNRVLPSVTRLVKGLREGTGYAGTFGRDLLKAGRAAVEIFGAIAQAVGPAVLGLAKIAGLAVGAGLKGFANTLGVVADFLQEHKVLVGVVAGAYLASFIPAITRATISLLDLARVAIGIQLLKLKDAALGLGGALSAISVFNIAALLGGAAIGAAAAMWMKAKRSAEAYRVELTKQIGKPKTLDDYQAAQKKVTAEVNRLQAAQNKMGGAASIWENLTGNTRRNTQAMLDNRRQLNEAIALQGKLGTQGLNTAKNIGILNRATGLSADVLEALANKVGVDLSRAAENSGPARAKIYREIEKIGNAAGLTGSQIKGMLDVAADPEALLAKMEKVGKVMEDVSKAFKGDFDVIGDFNAAMEEGAEAAENLAQAQEQVEEASRAVTRAHEQEAEAVRRNAQAIKDAEAGVAQANKRAEQAQEDLTRARKSAADSIEDLRRSLQALALDEEGATLSVLEARQRLNEVRKDPKATNLERRRANLAYREALANQEDIRRRRAEAQTEYEEAQRRGIEGSEEVKAANEAVTQSQLDQKKAAEELAEAHRESAKARDEVREANEALRKAQDDLRKAQEEFAEATLPASEKLKRFLDEALQAQERWSKNIAEAIRRGIDPAMLQDLLIRGPKEAGPFLEALLAGNAENMLGIYQNFTNRTNQTNDDLVAKTRIMQMALTGAAGDMKDKWVEAIRINELALQGLNVDEIAVKMTMTPDQVRAIATPFAIAVEEAKGNMSGLVQKSVDSLRIMVTEWNAGAFKTEEGKQKVLENLKQIVADLQAVGLNGQHSFTTLQQQLLDTAETAKNPQERIDALQKFIQTLGQTEAVPTITLNDSTFRFSLEQDNQALSAADARKVSPSMDFDDGPARIKLSWWQSVLDWWNKAWTFGDEQSNARTGGSWGWSGWRSGRPQADGGVVRYYAEGAHVAQIAPAGAMRVWAEPETGGEAYIPLSPAKRDRSLAIWRETGRLLGARDFKEGGVAFPRVRLQEGAIIRQRASQEGLSVVVNVTANFGPGAAVEDLQRAMRSIAQTEVTDAMVAVERRRRARQ